MNISVTKSPRRYITAGREWLHRDDAGPVSYWVTDPRASLAFSVSDLGNAIARLGSRIHRDALGDYSQGQRDGWQLGMITAAHAGTREHGARLLEHFGIRTGESE